MSNLNNRKSIIILDIKAYPMDIKPFLVSIYSYFIFFIEYHFDSLNICEVKALKSSLFI